MHLDDLRPLELFDGLGDQELVELIDLGTEVQFAPGEELFREGAPAEFWWVLVEGKVDLVRHVGREETVLGAMDVPGRWAGGFRAWDDNGVYLATGRAAGRRSRPQGSGPVLAGMVECLVPVRRHISSRDCSGPRATSRR